MDSCPKKLSEQIRIKFWGRFLKSNQNLETQNYLRIILKSQNTQFENQTKISKRKNLKIKPKSRQKYQLLILSCPALYQSWVFMKMTLGGHTQKRKVLDGKEAKIYKNIKLRSHTMYHWGMKIIVIPHKISFAWCKCFSTFLIYCRAFRQFWADPHWERKGWWSLGNIYECDDITTCRVQYPRALESHWPLSKKKKN